MARDAALLIALVAGVAACGGARAGAPPVASADSPDAGVPPPAERRREAQIQQREAQQDAVTTARELEAPAPSR